MPGDAPGAVPGVPVPSGAEGTRGSPPPLPEGAEALGAAAAGVGAVVLGALGAGAPGVGFVGRGVLALDGWPAWPG
ncbi:Cysteine-rich, acidic integral membrane protein (fragment) [Parafrankia sp. Ea1.12]